MTRTRLRVFDETSEPLERRIATGLHKLGLAMKHENWLSASAEGLSPTQGQILVAIARGDGLRASDLARELGVSLPTVSDSVAALVDKGLVRKRPDPRHPRASLLELSAAGRGAAAKAQSWPELLASAVGVLAPAEQEAFHAGLVKMIAALQQEGRIPLARMCVSCNYFRPNAHTGALPHHCDYVDAPMAARHLRIDCAEHEPAAAPPGAATLELLSRPR